jgi:aspartyl-tRNA(Asn)/glutamyl-tRNA(Gln) amidotransferase subunit C
MSLDLEQIRRIARLARIAVSDAEAAATAKRLNGLLGLIDEMQAVDTSGIEPMAHALDAEVEIAQRLREDKAIEPDRREDFQALAPAVEGGLYLVPRVVE